MSHSAPGFRHEALLYAGEDEFLAGTVPIIRDAVAAEEPILVAVKEPRLEALKQELDGESEAVHFVDMQRIGRNPARIIPAWYDFVAKHGGDSRPLRGIGEPIWAERDADELIECQHHESLLNLAFADAPAFWLVCPYDTDALDAEVLEEARRSHPFIAGLSGSTTSDVYLEPGLASGPFDGELPAPCGPVTELNFDSSDMYAVRMFVSDWALNVRLDRDRAADLVLAVSELATNSVLHADGEGILRAWEDGDTVLCEVRDSGRFHQPLVGRERPNPDQAAGRGLWLVNHLCDLVQMRSSQAGNVVRLHMKRC